MPAWFTNLLNELQDKAMFALIGRNIIYNVSWEDPRIDCELLDLTADDTILMLTSGGCNVLDMLLEGPKRIVAADLNPRQSALLSLKIVAIQHLPHEQFFQLFALSNVALWKDVYPRVLRQHLPEPAREFWDAAGVRFFKSVLWGGASGFAAWLMLNIAKMLGLGGLIAGESHPHARLPLRPLPQRPPPAHVARRGAPLRDAGGAAGRLRQVRQPRDGTGKHDELHPPHLVPAHRRAREPGARRQPQSPRACVLLACAACTAPAQLHLFNGNIVRLACDNLFERTHIARDNYFYHGYMYGQYTRECCPRYLKPENYEFLKVRRP